eukprot:gb/GECG01003067.1/.p1 GENE.gb/GECG01003067.1/~~gb/GECG01003067.1/.p1  ORF type:complete len:181 (+),score=19.66 gb/GECG01003067.1/:1-543(+)
MASSARTGALPPAGETAANAAMTEGFARQRVRQERKQWKRDHPMGFVAKPRANPDGSVDLMTWDCKIPGSDKGPWEGAVLKLVMEFPEQFPVYPPFCAFQEEVYHPNVYPDGEVCFSILAGDWSPSLSIKSVLLGIQELLDNPNIDSAAQDSPAKLYRESLAKYEARVRQLVKQRHLPDK